MSFPTTGILDDFNRADGSPGSNWNGPVYGDPYSLTISGNQLTSAGANYGSGAWVASTEGPDFEFYAKVYGLGSSDRLYFDMLVDWTDQTPDGFTLSLQTGQARFWRINNGVNTLLKTWSSLSMPDGTQVGIARSGSTFSLYLNGVTQTGTASDTSFSQALYLSFEIYTGLHVDDFGGGTVSSAAKSLIYRPTRPAAWQAF